MVQSCFAFFALPLGCLLHWSTEVAGNEMWTHVASTQLEPSDMHLLYKAEDVIGAGNYTYFTLENPGHVIVSLEPLGESDPDLYISNSAMKPTSTDYTLASATCGSEKLHIPSSWGRPVTVAVSGGPAIESSRYLIQFERVRRLERVLHTYEWYERNYLHYPLEEVTQEEHRPRQKGSHTAKRQEEQSYDDEQEESLLWTVFIGFLKILVDLLL